MQTPEQKFKAMMEGQSTEAIIDDIRKTWNDPAGGIFREYGFEIIEQRLGEEESDRIYAELWSEAA